MIEALLFRLVLELPSLLSRNIDKETPIQTQ